MARINRTPHGFSPARAMKAAARMAWCCLAMVSSGNRWAGVLPAAELSASGPSVSDILTLLDPLPRDAESLRLDAPDVSVPQGGHLQGIQQLPRELPSAHRTLVLSHDSASEAYLVVAEIPADGKTSGQVIHVQRLPTDGQLPLLRHAGGMQLAGSVLAVGVEDNQGKLRSEIQFWDFSNPQQPAQLQHLTIRRRGSAPKDMTAGAVGLVRGPRDYLLAVANWDSRAVDFYVSNGLPLGDAKCRFAWHSRWEDARADKRQWRGGGQFGTYQAINLVVDSAGRVGLVGFDTTLAGEDLVDLFVVDFASTANLRLRKVATKSVRLVKGNHFRFAGGIAIDADKASLLASPRTLERETTLSIVSGHDLRRPIEPVNPAQ